MSSYTCKPVVLRGWYSAHLNCICQWSKAVSRIWLNVVNHCSWVVFIVTLQTTALFHNITTLSSLLVYFYFGYSDVHSSTATACISCFYGRYHSTMARVHRYYNFTTASFGKHSLVVCLCDGWSSRVISWMVEGCMDDPDRDTST